MTVARPLSRDRILKAAFAIADKRGLEALTMRNVAARLNVEAMSLYHHVPSKKAMVSGLIDLLIQVADLPTGEVTVEEWIRGTAEGLKQLARKHPRVIGLLSSRTVPLDDPVSALPFEAGLAAFVREGRDVAEAFAAVQSVALSLLAITSLEAAAALTPDLQAGGGILDLDPSRFPLLHDVSQLEPDLDGFWSALTEGLVRGFAT